ncbi:hypothetical protein E2C01_095712 [Portunus trituberculatus]|uniref:Uncharacterized protein n=1 Tax=Portunus trituberculatus TaxID=210409 RepID=A0A5B7JQJ2_PORTR|nr:hypothetical protein [Portunus trituberculatus]
MLGRRERYEEGERGRKGHEVSKKGANKEIFEMWELRWRKGAREGGKSYRELKEGGRNVERDNKERKSVSLKTERGVEEDLEEKQEERDDRKVRKRRERREGVSSGVREGGTWEEHEGRKECG